VTKQCTALNDSLLIWTVTKQRYIDSDKAADCLLISAVTKQCTALNDSLLISTVTKQRSRL